MKTKRNPAWHPCAMGSIAPAVDLIAAGYEWICPDASCYAHNTVIEASEVVTCRLCKTSYPTNPPEHALP